MSHVLGPIHYWLYGKIGNQEELTNRIAVYAEKNGWIPDSKAYEKELPPLEQVIDESNIHGWLQSCIHDAETRYAELITEILSANEGRLDSIRELAFFYGKDKALPADISPKEAYEKFESFFVNGMPCDRINTVTAESENAVSWQQTRDIHAPYWKDTTPYYLIRESIMRGMLSLTKLQLTIDENTYSISR